MDDVKVCMDPMRLFPDVNGMESTADGWRIEPLPHPRFDVACPVCRRGSTANLTVLLRRWTYHARRSIHANQVRTRRCDVSFKCTVCACVWQHGLVVSDEHYRRRTQQQRHYHWREGRNMIAAAYYETEDAPL